MDDYTTVTITCFACQMQASVNLVIAYSGSRWHETMKLFGDAGWAIERPKNLTGVIRYCPTCAKENE